MFYDLVISASDLEFSDLGPNSERSLYQTEIYDMNDCSDTVRIAPPADCAFVGERRC